MPRDPSVTGILPDTPLDVVVVGAGVAGLLVADLLKSAGLDVAVLEANDRPGGRIRTIRYGSLYAEAGAMVVTENETDTLALLRDLSIEPLLKLGAHGIELFAGGRSVNLSRVDGRVRRWQDLRSAFALCQSLRGMGVALPYHAIPGFLHAYRRALNDLEQISQSLERPYHPGEMPALDNETFADFLDRFHPHLTALFDLQLKVTAGALADRISLFWGLVTSDWNTGGKFYWIRGGTSRLPDKLAERLGNRLRLNTAVDEIISGDVVRTRYRADGSSNWLYSRAVVLATKPSDVAAIRTGLPSWKTKAMRAVEFGVYIPVHLHFAGRFWAEKIKTGYMNCSGVVFADLVDGTRDQKGREGILIAFLAGPEARRLIDASDDDILAKVLADLERVFPGRSGELIEARVFRWPEAIPYFPPGYGSVLTALRRPWDKLFFCGDYTEGAGIDDAVLSARRAAREVLALFPARCSAL